MSKGLDGGNCVSEALFKDISFVNKTELNAVKSFFQILFSNLNISVSIKQNQLIFSQAVPSIYMQGMLSQNFNLVPSSHFMK